MHTYGPVSLSLNIFSYERDRHDRMYRSQNGPPLDYDRYQYPPPGNEYLMREPPPPQYVPPPDRYFNSAQVSPMNQH